MQLYPTQTPRTQNKKSFILIFSAELNLLASNTSLTHFQNNYASNQVWYFTRNNNSEVFKMLQLAQMFEVH